MPRRRAASMRFVPASTSISLPSMVSFGISILGGGLRPPSDAPRSGLPPPRTASGGGPAGPPPPPPPQECRPPNRAPGGGFFRGGFLAGPRRRPPFVGGPP